MKILVMGPGCPKCEQAEKTVREAVAEAGIEADIEKVKDFQEIAKHGIFSTPAVVIDGEVKVVGKAPSKKEVLGWLK
ncbi:MULTISPECIES: thioredoxin family protein [unclassified Pseudodesulfovibrio]|uniref:thioredoxin family protein n=1 Tax=unclassified Pseudodesulfovibrio TaxID=2661612 RepID=UPI000FEBB532|nr:MULTISPECIES: thioredoxin family protein [unclassified Pseudodesulfovibrio]MCJ2165103.1 thioredoxin family protein [Pseudodesulfovibrio sp. S3-i]RWU03432.1 thioredoxin family protein [Pseudodesulfovibrio sp. S3]